MPSGASVFSNAQVTADQLGWLMAHFDAQKSPAGSAWTIQVGPEFVEVVGVEDGSDDIAAMPSEITQAAAQWLGGPPQFRLALMIGDSVDCVRVAWNVGNEFGRWWPAIWSNHSTEPVVPLGTWWRQ